MGNTKPNLEREMTLKTTKLRDAINLALAVSATALAGTGVAFAQDTPATTDQQATTLDRIEVTGSRIPRAEIENEQPIVTVTREQIEKQGFSSVADILQNLTSAGSPAIARAEALASGENVGGYYIDLRNLGAQRTLILLNGKRLGATTSGLQDLGQIPMAAIERIDVLKDGASSIYGSDAIAGVVNVITRKNFEGAEANAYIGQFDEGEGKQAYSFTMGAQNDRGSLAFTAEYSKEDPVLAGDREFSKYGNSGKDFPFSGWSLVSLNGVWLGGNCGSGLCTLDRGSDPADPNNYHSITPAERANPNLVMDLQTGLERKSLFFNGAYDITDNIRFTAELGYNKRTTTQQIAGYPGQYYYGLLSADSYFNPQGNRFNEEGSDAYWFRRFWEVPRTTRNELNTLRVALGFEGTLNFGEDHQWNWDVGFLSNENQNNKYQHGDAYLPALTAALGPSYFNPDTGRVECGSAGAPIDYGSDISIGQCIPFSPFTPYGQAGPGSLGNADLQKFLFPEYHDAGTTKTTDYTANIAGSLFSLPAGDVGLAVGFEHRREEGRFVPDAVNQAGQSTGLAAGITEGGYDLDEAYAELEVPILKDVPFARELTFNVASRYSRYSNFGNTTNNKFQMRWRPIEGLLVRATYAEGFRAPSINDLFGGSSQDFAFYVDPCAVGQAGNGNALCTAAGVPASYVQLGQGNVPCTTLPCQTSVPFISGSNPNLGPETAVSKTAGIVWSPKWVDGLDFSLDWYKVQITNGIQGDSATNVLADCYVANIPSRCASVTRDPVTHKVITAFEGLANVGGIRNEGWDFGVNYRLPEFSVGKFSVNWQSSYSSVQDLKADQQPETPWVGVVGYPGNFRLRSNLGLNWEKGDYSIAYMARYYSGMKESCATAPRPCSDPDHLDLNGDADPLNRTGSNTFHDLQFSVKLPWNATAAIGANNITDHLGPLMFSTPSSDFPYYGGFDIGRFWYLKYQQRF